MVCCLCGSDKIENEYWLPKRCTKCGAVKIRGKWIKNKKLELNAHMFSGREFNAIMAEDSGRRLWVTYYDGGHFFKVEKMGSDIETFNTLSLGCAIRTFNEM